MIFINEPRAVSLSDYQRSIDDMAETVAGFPGVLAIYQIGGLSTPGISDIDMVVVFEDGTACDVDPRISQNKLSNYLFVHPLYGALRSLFEESRKYTFFHNFKLLHGEELRPVAQEVKSQDDKIMQRQLAREYLVRMLANQTVEREFGIYKIRSLLLQGKALLYDLEFLDEEPELLMELIRKIYHFRDIWFTNRPSNQEMETFYNEFWIALVEFLSDHLSREPLYLPNKGRNQIARNIYLNNSETVSVTSKGLKIPWVPKVFARKGIAIQHRLNTIDIGIPIQQNGVPKRVSASFDYTRRARESNRKQLPYFMPLTSSLTVF